MDALDPRGRVRPSMGGARGLGYARDALMRVRCRHERALGRQHRRHHGARATVESDANWHNSFDTITPPELQERIFTSRRVTANTERGEASVASSRQRATERDSRAFGAPRASAEAVVAKAGVCARQRRPPNTALTGAL